MSIGEKIEKYNCTKRFLVSENIKNIREQHHISQRELGRRINKTGQYISYLEISENINPSLDVLNKIAETLGVSINNLISSDAKEKIIIPNKVTETINLSKISTKELINELHKRLGGE